MVDSYRRGVSLAAAQAARCRPQALKIFHHTLDCELQLFLCRLKRAPGPFSHDASVWKQRPRRPLSLVWLRRLLVECCGGVGRQGEFPPQHPPMGCARTGEARGASRPPLCRPWPRREHVGRRTHLAPSPPWPQSLTSRPTSRYPACLCAIRPLSGRSCKFSLWGQGGHRVSRCRSGGLWVG